MTLHLPPAVPVDAPLLVAYSGGADSRLLLSLAKDYGDRHGVSVYAAHLHHGIRGAEADRDLDFCRRTAAELSIPLFEKRVDIPALCRTSGQSLEAEARTQRYSFFCEVMEAHHVPLLLTAHHADDQLETLLHRFLRGSGTRGMGGIPEVRPLAYGTAVRPLLSMTKADILRACAELGLDYITDSTNEQPCATRNRIRMTVIPALEAIAGEGIPQEAAGRLSRAAREDDDCLTVMASEALSACLTDRGIPLSELQTRHPAIGKRMLSLAYNQAVTAAQGAPPDSRHTLSALHLEALVAFCAKGENGTALDLPLVSASIHKGVLSFRGGETAPPPPATPLFMGDTRWGDGRLLIRLSQDPIMPPLAEDEQLVATAGFPADSLPLPLWARTRAAGDIILNHGMHKKLKKLLCDKGVPPHLRDRLPLICYGEAMTPLWYPTVAFADGFPPPTEGSVLRVSVVISKHQNKEF